MHPLIELKGSFNAAPNPFKGGAVELPKHATVSCERIDSLISDIDVLENYWAEQPDLGGVLVNVRYTRVIAKSNRIQAFFDAPKDINQAIRGARYEGEGSERHHIVTYFLPAGTLNKTKARLVSIREAISETFNGTITSEELKALQQSPCPDITKTTFRQLVRDVFFVRNILVPTPSVWTFNGDSLVSLYRTGNSTTDLLLDYGINLPPDRFINDLTFRMTPGELQTLLQKAPHLVAMGTSDLAALTPPTEETPLLGMIQIPKPNNEPIIGAIDTLFDESVYFHEWVENHVELDPTILVTATPDDYKHGTAVTGLIVDGPSQNPSLDDGCGRFRVRHFGVGMKTHMSRILLLKAVRRIVESNTDIKVWNLSLGMRTPVEENSISPEAAELDRLQKEFDVIFVIAGTNKNLNAPEDLRIGAPADSINAVVVNASDRLGNPAPYSRCGPVLSFFTKPDLMSFGGVPGDPIEVCRTTGAAPVIGTSYAAPWIARKLAYLIGYMGMTREAAKALLIHSAADWNWKGYGETSRWGGYGMVPQDIKDVIETPKDEIRFMITGESLDYETYTFNLPVPVSDGKFPFVARATLATFVHCTREQGVDYTDTELDLHFGRVKIEKGNPKVADIKSNNQGDDEIRNLPEGLVRTNYRKWDNVKHISDVLTPRSRPRKTYGDPGLWGIKVIWTERQQKRNRKGLRFSVVVTLKELDGIDRRAEFIKLCQARGWMVNELRSDIMLNIHQVSQTEVVWSEP